jgi:hypothetical protein
METDMALLSKEEIQTLKSMSLYWNEVSQRENAHDILHQEFMRVYKMIGSVRLLLILNDYLKPTVETK